MATIHFRDDRDAEEYERVFIAESGWVAVSGEDVTPALYPADRIDRIEGSEDIYYDTVVLTTELGARRADEEGHVTQEPELVKRMIYELEID